MKQSFKMPTKNISPEKKKQYNATYYNKKADKIKAHQRELYQQNKERICARRKELRRLKKAAQAAAATVETTES